MHYVTDFKGVYPVVELPDPEHVTADILALFTLPQAFDLAKVLKAANECALILFARYS